MPEKRVLRCLAGKNPVKYGKKCEDFPEVLTLTCVSCIMVLAVYRTKNAAQFPAFQRKSRAAGARLDAYSRRIPMYYALLVLSTALFAGMFFSNQSYVKKAGTALTASLTFGMYSGLISALIMLCIAGFRIGFTPFAFAIAIGAALGGVLYTYCSTKALGVANLSQFSMFAMLGGMLLPFAYGILFSGEPLTPGKIIGCILVIASLILNVDKGRSSKKAVLFYVGVFIFNGLSGVFAAIHNSRPDLALSSPEFSFWRCIGTVVICAVILLIKDKKIPLICDSRFIDFSGNAVCNGIGNLLLLIALVHIQASVQYPIVTGCTMVFSTLLGVLRGEKLNARVIVALVLAVAASFAVTF